MPVIYAPRGDRRAIRAMLPKTVRAALYVFSRDNDDFIKLRRMTHVWLHHGDSDKEASFRRKSASYDVLVQLAQAPGRRLRPVELARAVILTRSGVTRLVQGLERAGLVERVPSPDDGRGSLVHLTAEGRDVLRRASRTHLAGVRDRFANRFDDDELRTLSGLLGRLVA